MKIANHKKLQEYQQKDGRSIKLGDFVETGKVYKDNNLTKTTVTTKLRDKFKGIEDFVNKYETYGKLFSESEEDKTKLLSATSRESGINVSPDLAKTISGFKSKKEAAKWIRDNAHRIKYDYDLVDGKYVPRMSYNEALKNTGLGSYLQQKSTELIS